jgi:hypothetical protein
VTSDEQEPKLSAISPQKGEGSKVGQEQREAARGRAEPSLTKGLKGIMISGHALALVMVVFMGLPTQQKGSDPWQAWRFLLGEWTAEGTGQPGNGAGSFTFALDLEGKILVRRNRADYPATKDRPAFSHTDLMVVYPDTEGRTTRAIYFDNEGHVIRYGAQSSEDQKSWTFLSDPVPSAPRFRLTYRKGHDETLGVKFEVAPPGKPDSFSTYLEAGARRKGTH